MPAEDVHAYEIPSAPGYVLCIGVPKDRVRPALWLVNKERGESYILAQFHGPQHAAYAVDFLDRMIESINDVIHHLTEKANDESTKPQKPIPPNTPG